MTEGTGGLVVHTTPRLLLRTFRAEDLTHYAALNADPAVDGAFLGMCGLHQLEWYPDDIEIGWRLGRDYWGQGYATEAASAWLEHAFATLHVVRVISVAERQNVRSVAVMHRTSMVLDHYAELSENGNTFQAVVHSITGDPWLRPGEWPGCTCAGQQPLEDGKAANPRSHS